MLSVSPDRPVDPLTVAAARAIDRVARELGLPYFLAGAIGYEEVLDTAATVQLDESTAVPVASLPGLALLKLLSWRERHNITPKDARDVAVLFRHYEAAGNQDRIYREELALLEAVGYHMDLAGPRLLGKDVRRMASPAALEAATVLLRDTAMTDRLITHMAPAFKAADNAIAEAERLLEQFKIGIREE